MGSSSIFAPNDSESDNGSHHSICLNMPNASVFAAGLIYIIKRAATLSVISIRLWRKAGALINSTLLILLLPTVDLSGKPCIVLKESSLLSLSDC